MVGMDQAVVTTLPDRATPGWDNVVQDCWREGWAVGDRAFFEYHCFEDLSSGDAAAWLRSHQQVTVIRGLFDAAQDRTLSERFEEGEQGVYSVRFADGLVWDVFEDELLVDPGHFTRPDPPSPEQARYRVQPAPPGVDSRRSVQAERGGLGR